MKIRTNFLTSYSFKIIN